MNKHIIKVILLLISYIVVACISIQIYKYTTQKTVEVVQVEETKNINDILKQIDTENAYNEVETLENYFYSNYIVEY